MSSAAMDWRAGCGLLFGACFGLGSLLLGRPVLGAVLSAGAVGLLWRVLRGLSR